MLKPLNVKVFGKIQMDELIFCLEKSCPRTQGKLLSIFFFFKQDKKPFNKKKALLILGE